MPRKDIFSISWTLNSCSVNEPVKSGEKILAFPFQNVSLRWCSLSLNHFCGVFQGFDSASTSQRPSNLSALKKRWEQAGNGSHQDKTPFISAPINNQSTFPTLTRADSVSEQPSTPKSPVAWRPPQEAPPSTPATDPVLVPPAALQAEEQSGMDKDAPTESKAPEKPDEQVPTSPRASCEKPRVPLTNLKMKFEKADDTPRKVTHHLNCSFLFLHCKWTARYFMESYKIAKIEVLRYGILTVSLRVKNYWLEFQQWKVNAFSTSQF